MSRSGSRLPMKVVGVIDARWKLSRLHCTCIMLWEIECQLLSSILICYPGCRNFRACEVQVFSLRRFQESVLVAQLMLRLDRRAKLKVFKFSGTPGTLFN